ncbi:MAG: hypothetical protein WB014_03830 [Methanosarcina sp.]
MIKKDRVRIKPVFDFLLLLAFILLFSYSLDSILTGCSVIMTEGAGGDEGEIEVIFAYLLPAKCDFFK